MMRAVRAAVTVLILGGCATSTITAFKDPTFGGNTYNRLGVFVLGMDLDAAVTVEHRLCEELAPIACEPGKNVISPVRQYTADEVRGFLEQRGIDAVLVIELTADQGQTTYLGSITNSTASAAGNASIYGNTAWYNGTAYGTTTTTPMYGRVRQALGNLRLFDRASGQIAWGGQIKVSGTGLLNTTDDAFISSATAKIAGELKGSGFFDHSAMASAPRH